MHLIRGKRVFEEASGMIFVYTCPSRFKRLHLACAAYKRPVERLVTRLRTPEDEPSGSFHEAVIGVSRPVSSALEGMVTVDSTEDEDTLKALTSYTTLERIGTPPIIRSN